MAIANDDTSIRSKSKSRSKQLSQLDPINAQHHLIQLCLQDTQAPNYEKGGV
jgi:hypothetical protein